MSKIVRASKYRHVFGSVVKKEECFDDLKVTRSAWDSNLAVASTTSFALIAESGGGGSFYVHPFTKSGKVDPKTPMVSGHKGAVMDLDFNPFNENLIASCSEDGTAKVWNIPEEGLKDNMTEAVQVLIGHKRKVGTIAFNPVANNILVTSAADFMVKVWDIQKGQAAFTLENEHTDLISSVQWAPNGSLLASVCKDKKLRVIDPRSNVVSAFTEGHGGVKGARVLWATNNKLITTGFSKTTEREVALWDLNNLSQPVLRQTVDSSSGLLLPYYDPDTSLLYLAGKGDGNIRYYELAENQTQLFFLSEFKSSTPLRGGCMLPKRAVNVSDCEVSRFFKVSVKMVEPISFQVPRKSEVFQDDLYPDTYSGEASLEAAEWINGGNAEPKTMSMAPGFVVKKKAADFAPEKQEENKVLSEKELREEVDRLTKRVAYLEAEMVKRDAKIKQLESK
jgi:coronin-1B/1C/6